ncbi:MAG: DNA repair protein RadA [Elusimicrobiota bacterium]
MKQKVIFRCQSCGYVSPRWLGKCNECESWNSFIEELLSPPKNAEKTINIPLITTLSGVQGYKEERMKTGIPEIDRILGGGMVPGSLILLGGAPGIGKSTLLLQLTVACREKVLYVSGEESIEQIKMRAGRLGLDAGNVFLTGANSIPEIESALENTSPKILIVDSVQTMTHPDLTGSAGGVGQIREVTSALMDIAKKTSTVIFLVGHITKEGTLAGPKVLEHMVDTVLYFEDENGVYRLIRSFKNRFGATSEIAVFEMTSKGLIEVDNPERMFYRENEPETPGTVIASVVEGTRPITIELQALVTRSGYGMARRQVSGIDFNRLVFLIAIIEKRLNISLSDQDIFVNIVGGMKVKEPSIDLAVITAILSSFYDIIIPKSTVIIGEVGLVGEVREVSFMMERLSRAQKLGITNLIGADDKNTKQALKKTGIKPGLIKNIVDLRSMLKK